MEKTVEREAVRQWVWDRREELLADLEMLVEIPSVSEPDSPVKPYGPECRRAADAFLKMGEAYGLFGRNCDYHAASLSVRPDAENETRIGIWTHLDVVAEGMTGGIRPLK